MKKDSLNLETEIFKTIIFFDLFDYPLTTQEIWQNLKIKAGKEEVGRTLKNIEQSQSRFIGTQEDFYFVAGRKAIIKTRQERRGFALRKIKRAQRIAKLFCFIPWVKMIAVGNIIGSYNLKDESDIDFFIITQKDRIWLSRFFCAGLMKALGLRPSPSNARDKICLSFFVSENALDLEKFTLFYPRDNSQKQVKTIYDIYFVYWLSGLNIIYEKNDIYKKFIKANRWIKKYLPNWQPDLNRKTKFPPQNNYYTCTQSSCQPYLKNPSKYLDTLHNFSNKSNINLCAKCKSYFVASTKEKINQFYFKAVDFIFGRFEQKLKKIQLEKMPQKLKDLINKDTRVVVNDNILKLHVKDRRQEYYHKWREKLNSKFKI